MGLVPPSETVVLDPPERLTDVASWHAHIPFAFWCIEALRPRVFVELGTHKGDSYCAFCQAVDHLSLTTACYAIDTWKGDGQAGSYGEEVLEELQSYHDPRYGKFSRLVRSTFDEAAAHFTDESIDLLHIDGLHTYEAIRHDFETWLPKLSRSAVVLFHDVNVRENDFGAWRFWEELTSRYPHFTFLHGHGLGFLVVGSKAPLTARRLAASSAREVAATRSFFAQLGDAVASRTRGEQLEDRLEGLAAQLANVRKDLACREDRVNELHQQLYDAENGVSQTKEAHVRELASRDEEVRALGGEVERLMAELAAARRELGERQAIFAELQRRAADAEHGFAELRARHEDDLSSLESARGALQARLDELTSELERREKVIEELHRTTAKTERETALLEQQQHEELATRDQELRSLRTRLDRLTTDLADAAVEIQRGKGMADDLRRRAAAAEAEGALLRKREEKDLASRNAEAQGLRRKVDELTRELATREGELSQIRAVAARGRAKLAEIYHSWSWKATRPIRTGERLAPRLTRGLQGALKLIYWAAILQLPSRLRTRRHARLVRESGLFDSGFYFANCPDVVAAEVDPLSHYLAHGAEEGRDPNPLFDTSFYLQRNPDVVGTNPLVHYLLHGVREGRDPSTLFDTSFYLENNPDVAASGMNPLAHYLAYGAAEGRACLPTPTFQTPGGEQVARSPSSPEPTNGLLVVDHRIPTPDQDSGSVRMSSLLKLLREIGYEITFVSDNEERLPVYEEALRRLGIEVHYGYSAAAAHLAEHGHRYRVALLSRPELAYRYLAPVRAYAPNASAIYDTVDLNWVRVGREAELTGDPGLREKAEQFRRMERFNTMVADLTLAITPEEKELLLAEVPGARIAVIPNVHSGVSSSRPWHLRKDLMFIGGFEHVPNVDAVKWFAKAILPLIQDKLPGVVFHVVGSKTPRDVKELASSTVRVAGHVPDAGPYFESCRVFVSPLRYGAGMKGKIGHSMSHGLPVVTTSIGAEGMMLADGENALIADGEESFADAVVRLYTDQVLWARLARNSSKHVQEHFSPEVVRGRLESVLAALGNGESRGSPEQRSSQQRSL